MQIQYISKKQIGTVTYLIPPLIHKLTINYELATLSICIYTIINELLYSYIPIPTSLKVSPIRYGGGGNIQVQKKRRDNQKI